MLAKLQDRLAVQHSVCVRLQRLRAQAKNLRIGSDSNEDSGDEVFCVGGDTGHIYFHCGDLGHSFDGRTWMPTCCLADELYKALKYHTIASGEIRCTLEWGFSTSMDVSRMNVLRNKIQDLSSHCPEGLLIAVEVNATTRHSHRTFCKWHMTLNTANRAPIII